MKALKVNGETQIYGLIGWPVAHTFSPPMHNAAFKACGINAVYLPFPVKEKNLKYVLRSLSTLGFKGVNVTIPYKERVMPYLSKIEFSASLVGAVNTIIIKNNKFIGHNTDWIGFIMSLKKDAKFNPGGKRAFIFGAGGAARAVTMALANSGLSHLCIIDIMREKGKRLALNINKHFKKTRAEFIPTLKNKEAQQKLKEADLIINATGIGMHKKDSSLVKPQWVRKQQLACDLIYNPPLTNFLKVYKKKGAKILNGEGLLLYQGAEAFELFTSRAAPLNIMRKALREQITSSQHGRS